MTGAPRFTIVAALCLCALAAAPAQAQDAPSKTGPGPLVAAGATVAAYYMDAYTAFQKASKLPPGPERDRTWREAAALYKTALELAPSRDSAPEAAIYGAYCYKQVGEMDQAISLYSKFIEEYGSARILATLEKGDPSTRPPRPPDAKRYQDRLRYLKMGHDALAAAHVASFRHRAAAEAYEAMAAFTRFSLADRRDAATNALHLYAALGDAGKVQDLRAALLRLEPSRAQKAEADFVVARITLRSWDERAPDEGENKKARLAATSAMEAYHATYKATAEAAEHVVEAAYHAYELRLAGKDRAARDWAKKTIAAFDKHKASAPNILGHNAALGSPAADMAAEVAYSLIDQQIKDEFDYDTGHHKYQGTTDQVAKAFERDLVTASEKWEKQLQAVITTYESKAWSVAARARQASLYDSLRTALYNTRPPALKIIPNDDVILKYAQKAPSSGDDMEDQADAVRQRRREAWRALRDEKLAAADKAMIAFYVEAVLWSRAWKAGNPVADRTIRRLGFFTWVLGDAALRKLSQGVVDPATKAPFKYKDGMFEIGRPGLHAPSPPIGAAPPLPAGAR